MRRWFVIAGMSCLVAVGSIACDSEECARMEACCDEIEGMSGVGSACQQKGSAMGDPKTCRSILETVQLMFDERDASPPDVCTGLPAQR